MSDTARLIEVIEPEAAALGFELVRVKLSGEGEAGVAGGRLDPPMTAVLDEAANVCRISDLPDLYSHLGSRGINVVTLLSPISTVCGAVTGNGLGFLPRRR